MKYLSYISTTLLGLIFLVSAFAKAWDSEAFADTLLLYGPQWFGVGAPILICLESVIGMMFLLRIYPRMSACIADVFILVVSAIYTYGVVAKGIEDCGCFGIFSKLYTTKPWMTYVRNAVLIVISLPALMEKTNVKLCSFPKNIAIILVAATSCFICGLAMRKSFALPNFSSVRRDTRTQTMEKLRKIYSFDADSSYLVYLFSFSCVHCQNSFANVQQYEQLHVVNKVVGIAIEDSEAQTRFNRIYQPQIEMITISQGDMINITGQLPVCLLIEGDSITQVQSGFVNSPGIFLK